MHMAIDEKTYLLMNTPEPSAQYEKNKTKQLFEEKMASILFDSYFNPSNKSTNGAFFIDNLHFTANIKILGQKLGIQTNSLNKDFRHHKIKCIQRVPLNKNVDVLDPKGWKIYQHSNSHFSLENIIKGDIQITSKWDKNVKIRSKRGKNQSISNESKPQNCIKELSTNNKSGTTIKIIHKKSDHAYSLFSEEEENILDFFD